MQEQIYEKLEKLSGRIKEEGYAPQSPCHVLRWMLYGLKPLSS
jgi:hypothetical protein